FSRFTRLGAFGFGSAFGRGFALGRALCRSISFCSGFRGSVTFGSFSRSVGSGFGRFRFFPRFFRFCFVGHKSLLMAAGLGVGIALHTDGLAGTFAGTGVGGGALSTDGKATQMPNATVALDALEALEVQTEFATQVAFDDVLAILNGVNDLRKLAFIEV